jgi:hypothetical protein
MSIAVEYERFTLTAIPLHNCILLAVVNNSKSYYLAFVTSGGRS